MRILKTAKSAITNTEFSLKTSGFVNIVKKDLTDEFVEVQCKKPSYEIGSSSKLNLKKPVENVWKLDDVVDEDIIDEDELLDEEDLQKPDPSSLRGKRDNVLCSQ